MQLCHLTYIVTTLATGLFDLVEGVLNIFVNQNPKLDREPLLVLPIPRT